MKTISTLCLMALPLLLTACEKEEVLTTCTTDCTTVAGRLVTANGQLPIGGAEVVAKWHYPVGFGYRSKVKARSKTNASGDYSISFSIDSNELLEGYFDVSFAVDEKQYYTIGEASIALEEARRDTLIQVADYLIPRKAYIRLSLANPAQFAAANEYFASTFNSRYGLNPTYAGPVRGGGPVVTWYRDAQPTTLPVAGDQPLLVEHVRTQNGNYLRTNDSLFIPAGTTREYPVTF